MKTNIKTFHHFCTVALSALLVVAVFLTSTHAKDLVSRSPLGSKASFLDDQSFKKVDDPMSKSLNDLHNHSDKTMLNHFAKSFGDASSLAANRREEKGSDDEGETPFSLRLFQAFFMVQVAYAYAKS